MSKLKLPVIIALVAVAAVAGLFMSGMVGGKSEGPVKKHVVEPVPLAGDFTINLKDGSGNDYAVLNVALQLEPMAEEEWATWSGANAGGHGGSGEAPGPAALAAYPKFADAINAVTSTFTAQELKNPEGKASLKQELLERFSEIAEQDAADYKAGAAEEGHAGPPYHVMDVFFPKYLISARG
jgi:flagellar basal body-associated protein FliL